MNRLDNVVLGAIRPAASDGPSPERTSALPYFDPHTVVSRDAQGHPVSRYADDSWNYSSLSTDGKTAARLHFFTAEGHSNPKLAAQIREQHKALIWLFTDAGRIRAFRTISNANSTASGWCRKAYASGVDLFAILSDLGSVVGELTSLNVNYVSMTSSLISTLCRSRKELKLEVQIPLQRFKVAINEEVRARREYNQTLIIPSRIYCAILAGLIARMDEIERGLEDLLDAFREAAALSRKTINEGADRRARYRELMAPVVERMKAFGYTSSNQVDVFIAGRLNFYQTSLMHTIVAFTGMRKGEASILPLENVLETFEDRGSTHYVIKGYSHKLNRGVKKATSWITSREGHRAVVLAQRIAMTILTQIGGLPSAGQQALLFPSNGDPFRAKGSSSLEPAQRLLVEAICPAVTQHDIDELNLLELDRRWSQDGIKVGKRWPLAFHQLRRSLSVYAHRSGMVSLPSLKGQLQHITDEMRAYYADGYPRAVNLVFDKDHFSHEWNAAKAESSYFGYAMGLLFSDDELIGQGAVRITQAFSTRTRAETLQLFKEGKLAYRETVLGGCVSTEECNALPLEPIPVDCLSTNCVNLVVFSKRLDYVIRSQETVVAKLEANERGSVEYRLEASSLQAMLKARRQHDNQKSQA